MRGAIVGALLLMSCSPRWSTHSADTAGARLEAAAGSIGLIEDVDASSPIGAWSRDTDRLCIVQDVGTTARIGVLVNYGEGQGCAASGTIRRSRDALDVRLGECRFTASFSGDRITFPAEVPAACDRQCVGRASIAALTVDRESASSSEAAMLRAPSGRHLCAAPD